ncbi:MAG TPA: TPM domain-containing protein [Casimicrobiaceae bacterium]|nr:TPM domain-containing protein [Casimicrobiaceae bacterium]
MFKSVCAALTLAAALALPAPARAQSGWESGTDGLAPIPPLTARVTDRTGTLAPNERAALDDKLARFEAQSGDQVVVLMVPSTKPEPIEAYSIRVAEAWKIGRKGSDNGVLFLVAKDDRKMRIEVGYGLEGVLTDAMSRRIIADDVAPKFREGHFAAGIDAGVDRIIATIGAPGSAAATPPTRTSRGPARGIGGMDFQTLLILLFVGVPVLGGILKRVFGRLLGSTFGAGIVGFGASFVLGSLVLGALAGVVAFVILLFLGMGSTFGRRGGIYVPTGGWGGGGFGGGGGGGFSGGGGSFGGGGASGSW